MKKILIYIGIALAAVSCNEGDEAFDASRGGEYVRLSASAPTRVTADGTSWELNDEIGVTTYDGSITHNLKYTISNAGTGDMVAASDADRIVPTGEDITYYAYSPYSATEYDTTYSHIACDLTTSQVPFLFATAESADDFVPLTFKNQYAKLSLSFESIYTAKYISENATVQLTGSVAKRKFSLGGEGWDNNEDEIAPIDITIENNKASIYVMPQEVNGKGIKVEITLDGKTYVTTLATTEWLSGKVYSYNIGICREALVQVTADNYAALGVNQVAIGCWVLCAAYSDKLTDAGMTTADLTETSITAAADLYTHEKNDATNAIYKRLLIDKDDVSENKTWPEARDAATVYDGVGYDDWRLPTIKELVLICKYNDDLSFSSNFYWSATSSSSLTSNAWSVRINGGNAETSPKTSSIYVRPVKEL